MMPNELFMEACATLAIMSPASSSTTVTSAWVKVGDFHRIVATLNTGSMTATGTLDAKLQQATDSSGTGAKDITGKAIVQLLAAASSNKMVTIEAGLAALDVTNGFGYLALVVTCATAASVYGATIQGFIPRQSPATSLNVAAVVQQIP